MDITRRQFLHWLALTGPSLTGPSLTNMALTSSALTLGANNSMSQAKTYGLIGRMNTQPGKRDELAQILIEGTRNMPGNISYIVALAEDNPDSLWITEIWADKQSHENSLSLPSVQEAIAKGRPLIAGFGERFETVPLNA